MQQGKARVKLTINFAINLDFSDQATYDLGYWYGVIEIHPVAMLSTSTIWRQAQIANLSR